MKKLIVLLILVSFLFMAFPIEKVDAKMAKSTTVHSYKKKNGTVVKTHSSTRHYNTTKKRKK